MTTFGQKLMNMERLSTKRTMEEMEANADTRTLAEIKAQVEERNESNSKFAEKLINQEKTVFRVTQMMGQ